MMEFLKKATDWLLQKEEDAAKGCHAKPEDIEKQIKLISDKKSDLEKKCEENIKQLEHILDRLEKIKEQSLKCER